jgi:UDPglucose 6-dehydrogenase
MKPDRVIIGTTDERAREVMRQLYQPFCRTSDRMIFMDARSAELTKYACNAYLAARISFMNDMANLADAVGADIELVRQGMGSDPRIGNKFLFPGVGYGGSCFPKDTRALLDTAREHGLSLGIVTAAERSTRPRSSCSSARCGALRRAACIGGKTLALWGLAFKPKTDDVRESPALLIDDLLAAGASVTLHDPEAMPNFIRATYGAVTLFETLRRRRGR